MDDILDRVKEFVDNELKAIEIEVDKTDEIPIQVINKMKKMGLFGINIPKEYGGLEIPITKQVDLIQVMGNTSPAFYTHIGTNNGIGSLAIQLFGTNSQKKNILPRLASGEWMSCFALTEKMAGSDAFGVETTAKKINDYWVISGSKRYITNSPLADIFTVIAKTIDENGEESLTGFLITRDTPGLNISTPNKMLGLKGSYTASIMLDECCVPNNMILGKVGDGIDIVKSCLSQGRLQISALSTGMAERLIQEVINHSNNRKQFGKNISSFQLIKEKIANMQIDFLASKSLIKDTAYRFADNKSSEMTSVCKVFSSEMVNRVSDIALQVFGGAGYMYENIAERMYRDARIFKIYEGTNEILKLIIAKDLLNENNK